MQFLHHTHRDMSTLTLKFDEVSNEHVARILMHCSYGFPYNEFLYFDFLRCFSITFSTVLSIFNQLDQTLQCGFEILSTKALGDVWCN